MDNSNRKKLRNSTRYIFSFSAFLIAAVVFLTFIIPLVLVCFPSLAGSRVSGFQNKTGFNSGTEFFSIFKITFFTLKIALGSTLVALVIGFPAAFFCAKRNFLFRKILLGFSAVPLCIPVLIAALGFVSVYGMSGILNKIFSVVSGGEKSRFLYSQWGIMIAQGFYNFPLIMSIVSRYWESLSVEKENAARLLGAGESRVFLTVTLPALAPVLVSSVIPVFLFCFFSFMMVLLFSAPGTSTLEVEIYQAVKTSLDITRASRLAACETVTALFIVGVYSLLYKNFVSNESQVFVKVEKFPLGKKPYENVFSRFFETVFFLILMVVILFFFVFPFAGIGVSGFTARIKGNDVFSLNQYKTLFKSSGFWVSLRSTIVVSLCTAAVSTITACVYSLSLQNIKKLWKKRFVEIIALLPMAVSSVVLGFGLTLIFKKGNVLSLVFVQSALFWPLAYRQINTALGKIPSDVMNAAKLYSSSYTDAVFRVFLPWIRKSIFSAFGFCFAFSAGDTTLPLILAIPKFQTLSLYTYRLSGSYRFNTACAAGTILALICFIVFVISEKAGGNK